MLALVRIKRLKTGVWLCITMIYESTGNRHLYIDDL